MTSGNGRVPRGFTALREPLTKRRMLKAKTDQGTEVWVAPMPGFTKAYALATTRYGSIDTHLPDGTLLPVGIAHFLEHKMFQTKEGDVFDLYAARGASANAFTTFDHTTYLFSCTSRFPENFETLLETMAEIHTDPKGVEKEKGIIGQEIAMYDDDPSWRGYFNLLGALYSKHPVRIDIAGTKETIAPIDPAILRRTHAAYYHPRNMVVVVAGDVDPAAVLERTGEVLRSQEPGARNARAHVEEPSRVAKAAATQALSISRPHVLLGMKDAAPGPGEALVKAQVEVGLVLDVLFSEGGRIQAPLYREGMIDDSFGASFEAESDYAFALVSAEVDAVEPFQKRLERAIAEVAAAGLTEEEVERTRRKVLGRHLRTFNSPEGVAHWLLGVGLDGVGLSAGVDAVRGATRALLDARLERLAASPRAWSILIPK